MADARASRAPLGDATTRVNNANPSAQGGYQLKNQKKHEQHCVQYVSKQSAEGFTSKQRHGLRKAPQQTATMTATTATTTTVKPQQRPQVHAHAQRTRITAAKAAISNNILHHQRTSSSASGAGGVPSRSKEGYKQLVGPWILGKTLGRGSNGQVRLCRHRQTGQDAAVKIISQRAAARFSRETSMAALSSWDAKRVAADGGGERRVPVAIEREVAILKLVDHPNILKLYDMWENRSDIYVVLELVGGGDLWHYIAEFNPLPEEHVLFFFRQTISAVSYCHDFNICHRDLKPENILLTTEGQIKICDFGMAALHQTEDHRLSTFCGSINYAAPELLNHTSYRGDRADVWSLGVILFIMLTTSLPFDDPDRNLTIERARHAHYAYPFPDQVSPEGRDLVDSILVVDPAKRIRIAQMWRHPLLLRYDYLDSLGGRNSGQPAGLRRRTELRNAPVPRGATDAQLLRQLRSMFHRFTDEQLEARLASAKPNDQKVFYWLLQNYREKQLENFSPDIAHSVSDYHHLRPGPWRQRVSTRSFVVGPNDRQSVSKFTVISNVAEHEHEHENAHEQGPCDAETKSDAGTVQSYDPYRASRVPLPPRPSQVGHAKYVIHGRRQEAEYLARIASARRGYSGSNNSSNMYSFNNYHSYHGSVASGSTAARRPAVVAGSRIVSPRTMTTVNTTTNAPTTATMSRLNSPSAAATYSSGSFGQRSRNSRFGSAGRQGTGALRHGGAALRRRGLVDFTHMRQQSLELKRRRAAAGDDSESLCVPKARRDGAVGTQVPPTPVVVVSTARPAAVTLNVLKVRDPHHAMKEAIRHFSSEVAKDLDKAFNSSLIPEDSFTFLDSRATTPTTDVAAKQRPDSSGLTFSLDSATPTSEAQPSMHPWDSRPLPPLPGDNSGAITTQHASVTPQEGLGIRFSLPKKKKDQGKKAQTQPQKPNDRRVVSAPAGPSRTGGVSTLPAINETVVAAPNWVAISAGSDGKQSRPQSQQSQQSQQQGQALQQQKENHDPRARITSAPANYAADYFSHVTGDTIRVVHSPSRPQELAQARDHQRPSSAAAAQEAITHTSTTPAAEEEDVAMPDAPPALADDTPTEQQHPVATTVGPKEGRKRVNFWFKRSSKAEAADDVALGSGESSPPTESGSSAGSQAGSGGTSGAPAPVGKKKTTAFGLRFWRSSSGGSGSGDGQTGGGAGGEMPNRMTISDGDFDNAASSIVVVDSSPLITPATFPPATFFSRQRPLTRLGGRVSAAGWYSDPDPDPDASIVPAAHDRSRCSSNGSSNGSGEQAPRTIDVKQSWLARLFRVKPATSHLCMGLSRKRARGAVARLLRDWRNHGIEDVEVDKERNIIFARVGSVNSLNLKPVSFAAEIMAVVEHGNPNPLSIVRLTQERGAASSFARVAETLRIVLASRGLLVADKHKAKMMIKTLNS